MTNHATPTRTHHRVPTPDGRHLAVDVTGPTDGPVVLFLHSAPGSRAFDPDPAATAAAGIRLVSFDRPGYGRSTPLPADATPSVPGHAADAALVVEALEAGPVAVVGWSAGGRIGAALAAARPDLVRSLAIVATPAPDDQVPWVPEQHRALSAQLRTDPASALATLLPMFAGFPDEAATDDGARALIAGGPADEALLAADTALARVVAAMVRTGAEGGGAGLAADIVADQVVPWGFERSAITAPTTCWYGAEDTIVTPAHGRWWADGIDGARLHVEPDVGHLVVATAWAEVLAARP